MTFRDFARNYLNPGYLIFRACWVFGGLGFLFVSAVAQGSGAINILFFGLGALFLWNGLRLWGKGTSLHEINKKLHEMNNR